MNQTLETVENDVTRFAFCDDIYAVDVSRGFSVVAHRCATARFVAGDDFRRALTPEEAEELRKYLVSFEARPMLLNTEQGAAIIYADAFPSTLNFLVCYPDSDRDYALSTLAALAPELDIFVPPIYRAEEAAAKPDKKTEENIRRSMLRVESVFKRDELALASCGRAFADTLKRSVFDTAALAGCRVGLKCPLDIALGEGFDCYLFKIFLLLFFMTARENTYERRATVELKNGFEGLVIRAECELFAERIYKIMPLFNSVSAFSERYNIRCSCTLEQNRAEIEICPVRKDWSLLDLKSSFNFDWNS